MLNFKNLKEEKVYVLYKDNPFPARKLNWFQKLIVKLQDWWYSGD